MYDEKAQKGKALLKNLNLSNDFLFMHVMEDEEICKEVVEEILNVKIDKIVYLEEQKGTKINYQDKGVRFDVYVNDSAGTIYNIEMQSKNTDDIPRRSRYYQGNIDVNYLLENKMYKDLKECYVVFICCFDLFGRDDYKYTFKNRCEEYPDLELKDGAVKIFLNTRGKRGNVSHNLKAFLKYAENSTDEFAENSNSELVKKVHEKVKTVKTSNEMGRDYMTMVMRDRENFNNGKAEGKLEEKMSIVKEMLKNGLSTDLISKIANISSEELIKIQGELALS